ncbi:hypothetical protein QTG54_005411 [Skeletonema marinoi]|uniref:Uncharacterized protein n=1 Tax=Skeletonema marinoi TaxID=267567 RepID=A0AAD8YCA3_9STRA|nr:hypothetical protein QTG54_005411 [Skeletonema marinoi]|mmetsp:Transcript_7192/g.14833  ORF Transcript_7192/g.14833 Transcript_7192/m.14833 type:complete len:132 (+) Transcript_7192:101-496(+)
MSKEESASYGAIPRGDAEDAEFDERNLSYLQESGFSWNRFCRAALPIILALLIMGGFAFGMGHGFGNLYGPPKISGDNSIKGNEKWYSSEDASATTKSPSGAKCAANSKCKALGLTGDCCPNLGVMLGCCD